MSGNYRLSDIIEHMYGELEDGVEPLLESESVGELARSGNYELEVVEELNPLEPDFLRGGGFTTQYGDEDDTGLWAFSRDGVLYVNELALKEYEDELSKLKTELDVNEEQRASSAG